MTSSIFDDVIQHDDAIQHDDVIQHDDATQQKHEDVATKPLSHKTKEE